MFSLDELLRIYRSTMNTLEEGRKDRVPKEKGRSRERTKRAERERERKD